jgi:hypothetical protein
MGANMKISPGSRGWNCDELQIIRVEWVSNQLVDSYESPWEYPKKKAISLVRWPGVYHRKYNSRLGRQRLSI